MVVEQASQLMSKISEMRINIEALEREREQMRAQEEHNKQIEGLKEVIGQKDQEINSLKEQVLSMQESVKHLMDDLNKSKIILGMS